MGWLFGEPEDYPPGTDGWPIIGVLASAGDYLQRTLKQWSLDYYGPIFFVSIGGRRQIVLNTVEAIKEVGKAKTFQPWLICTWLKTAGVQTC